METRQPIVETLMKRDGITRSEATAIKRDATEELVQILENGGGLEEAYELCYDYFGLEPDYLDELLPF